MGFERHVPSLNAVAVQVPRHLFLSDRLQELNHQVLFNYLWIYNKTKALSFQHMLADFLLNPGVEATLVGRALRWVD